MANTIKQAIQQGKKIAVGGNYVIIGSKARGENIVKIPLHTHSLKQQGFRSPGEYVSYLRLQVAAEGGDVSARQQLDQMRVQVQETREVYKGKPSSRDISAAGGDISKLRGRETWGAVPKQQPTTISESAEQKISYEEPKYPVPPAPGSAAERLGWYRSAFGVESQQMFGAGETFNYKEVPQQIYGPSITTMGDVPGRLTSARYDKETGEWKYPTVAKDIFSYQHAKGQAVEEAFIKGIGIGLPVSKERIKEKSLKQKEQEWNEVFGKGGKTVAKIEYAGETAWSSIGKGGEFIINEFIGTGAEYTSKGTLQIAALTRGKPLQEFIGRKFYPKQYEKYSALEQKQYERVMNFSLGGGTPTLGKSELGGVITELKEYSKPVPSQIATAALFWGTVGTTGGFLGPTAQKLGDIAYGAYTLKKGGEAIKSPNIENISEAVFLASPYVLSKAFSFKGEAFGKKKSLIEDTLVKRYGETSPEVKAFRSQYARAFEELPRRAKPQKEWSPEYVEALDTIKNKLTNLKKPSENIFYHYTSKDAAQKILKEGLKPTDVGWTRGTFLTKKYQLPGKRSGFLGAKSTDTILEVTLSKKQMVEIARTERLMGKDPYESIVKGKIKPEQIRLINESRSNVLINIQKVFKEYKPYIVGTTTIPPQTTLKRPPRGLGGDIDVQAVLKGGQEKYFAKNINRVLKDAGIKSDITTSTFAGKPKYHVRINKQEFLNIGTSTAYFQKTQVPAVLGWAEPATLTWVPTKSGIRLSNIADQMRKKFEMGYLKGKPSEVIRRLEIAKLYGKIPKQVWEQKAAKIGGRAKDIVDVAGIYKGTSKYVKGGKFIGEKISYFELGGAKLEEWGIKKLGKRGSLGKMNYEKLGNIAGLYPKVSTGYGVYIAPFGIAGGIKSYPIGKEKYPTKYAYDIKTPKVSKYPGVSKYDKLLYGTTKPSVYKEYPSSYPKTYKGTYNSIIKNVYSVPKYALPKITNYKYNLFNVNIPNLPPPVKMDFKFFLPEESKKQERELKRVFKYKPTIEAVEYKIKGKKPKTLTGLEVRPIL